MGARLTIGVAAATLPVLAWAVPAGASRAAGQDTVTFSRNGQQVTCTLAASTENDHDPDTDRTSLRVTTTISGDGCREASESLSSATTYANEHGEREHQIAQTFGGPTLLAFYDERGRLTEVSSVHEATFDCDGGPPELCSVRAQVTTSPK